MEGLGQLIIFSIVMLVGSYGAGSAPLFMPMSEEKLHLVSVMGAGLLVGEKNNPTYFELSNAATNHWYQDQGLRIQN